jgi:hypothetical protein
MKKKFKIARKLDENRLLCIAEDGECWSVPVHSRREQEAWGEGDLLEVEMRVAETSKKGDRRPVPTWENFPEGATPYQLAEPYNTIKEIWGLEAAEKYASPDEIDIKKREAALHVKFIPQYFKSTNQVDAGKKAWIAEAICRFIANDFRPDLFSKTLHKYLNTMFEFEQMEHREFYDHWFASATTKLGFLHQIVEYLPNGDSEFSMCDVEVFARNWVVQYAYERWTKTAETAVAKRDRETLVELLKKYGLPEQFRLPGQ